MGDTSVARRHVRETVVRPLSRAAGRPCARPGCPTPARATLAFRYDQRQAVLVGLSDEASPDTYDLCGAHADRTAPPHGWGFRDDRPVDDLTPVTGPPRDLGGEQTVAVLAAALRAVPDALVDAAPASLGATAEAADHAATSRGSTAEAADDGPGPFDSDAPVATYESDEDDTSPVLARMTDDRPSEASDAASPAPAAASIPSHAPDRRPDQLVIDAFDDVPSAGAPAARVPRPVPAAARALRISRTSETARDW